MEISQNSWRKCTLLLLISAVIYVTADNIGRIYPHFVDILKTNYWVDPGKLLNRVSFFLDLIYLIAIIFFITGLFTLRKFVSNNRSILLICIGIVILGVNKLLFPFLISQTQDKFSNTYYFLLIGSETFKMISYVITFVGYLSLSKSKVLIGKAKKGAKILAIITFLPVLLLICQVVTILLFSLYNYYPIISLTVILFYFFTQLVFTIIGWSLIKNSKIE